MADEFIDPPIVKYAAQGNLKAVKKCINQNYIDVDACGQWTETEEKYGYEKSWNWKMDTPLLAAVRHEQIEVVTLGYTLPRPPPQILFAL